MLTLPRAFLLALHKSGSSSLAGNGAQGSEELSHIFFSPVLLLLVFFFISKASSRVVGYSRMSLGNGLHLLFYQKFFCFAVRSNYLFQFHQLHS